MLFVGDDWAEDHHDVELMDAAGRTLARARLPEGVAGITRLHAMIGAQLGEDADGAGQVTIGIETDRGPWVQALIAAGYTVLAVNPLQAARYRDRLGVSGAKSDAADAHMLADMVRTDGHQLRRVAGDSAGSEAVKVVARMHKTLIWERTRASQRLRHALREYFPAALAAFDDLDAADTLELLARAPDPASAARLSISQISAALKRARRRDIPAKAAAIQAVLRAEHLSQPAVVTAAYAASVRALIAVLGTLNEQVKALQGQVEAYFGQHPDAEIILSQPGLGTILGARVLAEFGDAADRYTSAKARKNYAGTSPITRASGKKRTVAARFVHNDRLIDALMTQAFASLNTSPGARAYYDRQRARGASYNAALRQLANRLVGILHGCLKTGALYDEATAWSHHLNEAAA
ncbi:Transposase IS116/IS110/IS902 family protein [Micromonospora rhizosphaerae]|uniref:Transposase IS116/IS110/IS902 family protein n=1 Tax=Micromonospora rhizosphaerae TaxID=568872 RepID=A0A1C6RB24_9ACTN|nr:IS110 family transposase [Micromonospora rhizosphaerae]SCL14250.1 Transposase IS116/IS110/IS902 family protein [Micromonospora rhizosphaerae]SCL15198.1 Transposase IS116/IS110/IS902 family protein [Micromonospora rhizosphaerae]SCL20234.1 Transposase IS116/IS110/IS902 family protein [Micromonospora rhizosphaerae]SCL22813.1 Transposase IS116/IS110/IS902 family protein [Micromonospora rhizosphaerae]SCL37881.1 Transposase IS116/IS110/IS902 family protein [Micromonospora rhizosphaerae]